MQRRTWISQALFAGLVAAGLGTALATYHYLGLQGAERLCWSTMPLVLLAFAVLSGASTGLGIGFGTMLAVRTAGGPMRASAVRMTGCAALGGVLGVFVPGIVGIGGFGALDAPYAGTANLVFSLLVSTTTFVTLWAPALRGPEIQRLGRAEHVGIAAMSSSLAIASVGVLGATLCSILGWVPSFDWLFEAAHAMGLLAFAAWTAIVLGAILGAASGMACWLYLTIALVLERRFR